MTEDDRPPLSRRVMIRVMPVVFRIVNVPMRFILSLRTGTPLGKRLMLVYLAGRRAAGIIDSRSATSAMARRCSHRVEASGS